MILFDTDICLSLLRGSRNILDSYADYPGDICVSPVTVQELFSAACDSENPEENRLLVEKFLLTVKILQDDIRVMKKAALIRRELKRRNRTMSLSDILVFAASSVYSAKLVTANGDRYKLGGNF